MSSIIGIDLGTTQSCVAYLDGLEPRIIPNLEGLSNTPSVISFTEAGDELIGNLALRQASTNPEKTVYAVKRLMGKKYRSKYVQETKKKVPYRLSQDKHGNAVVKIDSKILKPEDISAMILTYLRKCAESYFGDTVSEAVITVPAHFDDHQRSSTKEAAQMAGLKVIRMINEPTAASLSYGLDSKKDAVVAVYDLGGGTFDFTLLEINEGIFNVLATNGNTYLGGEDFNQRIIRLILDEFQKEHKIDLSHDNLAMQRSGGKRKKRTFFQA
jgi:molecular chaperone DnaK